MADRTEAPTARRLAEARKEGQVARSQELNAALALLVGTWLVIGPGKSLGVALEELVVSAVTALPKADLSAAWLREVLVEDLQRVAPGLGLVLLGMLATGVTVTVGQTGFLWAGKRLGVDLSRLNPFNGLRRLFSAHGLVELLRALLKLAIVGWVTYSFLRTRLAAMLGLSQLEFNAALQTLASLASALAVRVGGAYFALACLDYAYQRWQHVRSLRMTKQEVREDLKRSEGDPLLRSRIRSQQRRIARMRMMANVKKADVVITNPTHLAVAVQYEAETMRAPKVLAKGAHRLAERIVEIARSHRIPIVENVDVARALYRSVEVEQEIPPELYRALAEILAYVFKLRQKAATGQ